MTAQTGAGFSSRIKSIFLPRSIRKRDEALKDLSEAFGAFAPLYQNALPHINFELSRARRYKQTLAIAAVSSKGISQDELLKKSERFSKVWANRNLAAKFVLTLFGSILREGLRDSDLLSYDVLHDRFILLLTNTGGKEAEEAMLRLQEIVRQKTQLDLSSGVSEFPADGLTVQELVKHAQDKIDRRATDNVLSLQSNQTYNGRRRSETIAKNNSRADEQAARQRIAKGDSV